MKCVLVLVVLSIVCTVAYGAISCIGDEKRCGPDDCCLMVGPIPQCRPRRTEDESCEVKPKTQIRNKHVYKYKCPCLDEFHCADQGGLLAKLVGKCQANE